MTISINISMMPRWTCLTTTGAVQDPIAHDAQAQGRRDSRSSRRGGPAGRRGGGAQPKRWRQPCLICLQLISLVAQAIIVERDTAAAASPAAAAAGGGDGASAAGGADGGVDAAAEMSGMAERLVEAGLTAAAAEAAKSAAGLAAAEREKELTEDLQSMLEQVRDPQHVDCPPIRLPESPRIVMRCAPRAPNGPHHLAL